MKAMIRWAAQSSPAMNTIMVAVMLLGLYSFSTMRRELFPEFELEIVLVTVPYPGASPDEVEEGICQKIEQAVRTIAGIKKSTSVAKENFGYVILELESNIEDAQRVLNEVRSEVDRIPSFPELAENREIKQITLRQPALRVGVLGPESEGLEAERQLREVAEQVRNELLVLKPLPPTGAGAIFRRMSYDAESSVVSQANIIGERPYQIDVEIPEETLRQYGLSLKQVSQILRQENVDIPGGTLKSDVREVLLRGKNKRNQGAEIAKIPLVTRSDGVVLTVGDLGAVKDGFSEVVSIDIVQGKPAQVISVDRTSNEDVLAICDRVQRYAQEKQAGQGYEPLPPGYQLVTWFDQSVNVRDRMLLLRKNGVQGLLLVFLVLAIFLELKLAFWVALGIPISVLGAGAVLLQMGQTLNMLSMFAFLLALGIVVDDAIVIGENIYRHRKMNKSFSDAAISGTYEVWPAVVASITTTVIAFAPLFFVSGVMGKFFAVLPAAVITMLILSLLESLFILPCHLSHEDSGLFRIFSVLLYPLRPIAELFGFLNRKVEGLLQYVISRIYVPSLRYLLNRPLTLLSIGLAFMLLTLGLIRSGVAPFVLFPKVDTYLITAKVVYPDGTPAQVTAAATERMEAALYRASERLAPGEKIIDLTHRAVGHTTTADPGGADDRTNGSHVGVIEAELVDTSLRNVTSEALIVAWREETGEFPGAESLGFGGSGGPGGPAAQAIEFKLLAPREYMSELEAASEEYQDRLREEAGVFDVGDDLNYGKLEYRFSVKDRAKAMGITTRQLAETIRAAYYGEEAMRLQRGRHEVKLMVRYPREQRKSLSDLRQVRVRSEDRVERPVTELAEVDESRQYSEVNRVNQLRAITISADVNDDEGNAAEIVGRFQANVVPGLMEKYPHLTIRWEGQQEQTMDSVRSLFIGFVVALLAIFVVLTIEFKSYFQPFIILLIIPFGLIGSVWGHAILGLSLTLFSLCGIVALTGVVINDSIVLIDFINRQSKEGMPLKEAILEAVQHRFRPVLLTSLTTIAGLLPLLLETSFQAQLLKPMATSITFGLMSGTVLILYLVPGFYIIYGNCQAWLHSWRTVEKTFSE
jgi:multidrug efflux pump subunit AcrB